MNTSSPIELEVEVLHEDPPIILVKNLYDKEAKEKIILELNFLHEKLGDVADAGASPDEKGEYITSKTGLFLNNVYKEKAVSDILKQNKFVLDIIAALGEKYWVYSCSEVLEYSTLVSYYEEGDYYKYHKDASVVSAITWFYKNPKNFSGGELKFSDLNIKVPCEDNSMVIFPGMVSHEVTEVKMLDKTIKKSGRFSITQFFTTRKSNE